MPHSDIWDSNWHILVAKQCQLNLNFWEEKVTDTIDIFDYQTANVAGPDLPPTPSFLKEMKTAGFYLKK